MKASKAGRAARPVVSTARHLLRSNERSQCRQKRTKHSEMVGSN
ncbi:hypothetical protein SAMCCGM7_pC0134 (plasmid) [Sinorhizobium americanum CCGM7]|nr:hypothetical protein SAMCCGM7_pC0134 [Sinorhizobium americanum CCGM7]